MFELQGLQLRKSDFDRRNTEIVAVVVDSVELNAQVVHDVGLDFRILSDPQLAVIDPYGLRSEEGGKAMARPASFLIDADGIVRWRSVSDNFRLRPDPATILAAVDQLN
jgi:peroxiredoxin